MNDKIIQVNELSALSIDDLTNLYRNGYRLQALAVSTMTLSGCSATHIIGGTCTITAECKDSSGTIITCPTIIWTSSDPSKVIVTSTINNKGSCTLLAIGSSIITASVDGVEATTTITVTTSNPIELIGCSSSHPVGDPCTITAICRDTNGILITCPTLTWTNSNSTIVSILPTINMCIVTPLAVGTSIVTVSNGTTSVSKTITVTASAAKYKCLNGACVQDDINGTFLEPTCNNTCIVPKYKCVNGVCTRDDVNGTFLEPTCNNTCIIPKYKCIDGICTRDDINGTFTTSNCNNTCVVVTPKYKCVDNVCVRDDITGTFLEPTCNNTCVIITPKYKCSNDECVRDDINGTFLEPTCNNTCIVPMYKCNNQGICIRDDVNGTFLEPTCNNICVVPKYICNNQGVCTRDDINGTFTEPTCDNTCIIPKYKCVDGICTQDNINGTFLEPTCNNTCVTSSNNTKTLVIVGAGIGLLYLMTRK